MARSFLRGGVGEALVLPTGFAFPAYFVIKNWNALKYSKKRPPPDKIAEQAEKRYEKMYGKKGDEEAEDDESRKP